MNLKIKGEFDVTKFETNMKLSQRETVKPIDGMSYYNDRITSFLTPEDTKLVKE